jgi:VWFA-related protein
MRKRTILPIILFGLLLAAPIAGLSQAASGAASTGNGSRAIVLDVVVTGKSGAPAEGLQAGDFKLFDNKQPQSLVSVQSAGGNAAASSPVEAILLLDAVNLDFTTVANERKLLSDYLRKNGGQLALPTSLILLTDSGPQMPSQPTQDGNALAAYLNDSATGLPTFQRNSGAYSAEERWQISLRSLNNIVAYESRKPGRKLLIWLSTGWPAFSQATVRNTTQNQEKLFASVAAFSTGLRQARITLYSIDPMGAGQTQIVVQKAPESLTERRGGSHMPAAQAGQGALYYQEFLKGVEKPRDADYGDLLLGVLATQSGGQVFFGNNDLAGLVSKCIDDARAYYVLTFNSPAAAHPGEYHGIEVQVEKPGLKTRTRAGYYAQP